MCIVFWSLLPLSLIPLIRGPESSRTSKSRFNFQQYASDFLQAASHFLKVNMLSKTHGEHCFRGIDFSVKHNNGSIAPIPEFPA